VYPLLLQDLSAIRIASAKSMMASEAAKGDAPLAGTGPYRLAGREAHSVQLSPYSKYWGKSARWDTVTVRSIPDDRERLDALLAGRVDAIEHVVPAMMGRLREDRQVTVHKMLSGRLMFLQVGTHRVDAPELRYNGQPTPAPNPLLDRRVRRAMSEAIDRRELAGSVLQGLAEPAGQLVPAGYLGHVEELYGDKRDVEDARALLTESGYPEGFEITIHGPKDVYPADQDVLASIARMLGDAGIRAKPVSEPAAAFATRGSRQQYSAFLRGFRAQAGDASAALRALLATHDAKTGAGSLNWSRYSNGTLDSMIQRAMSQGSYEARALMLQEATTLAMKDVALIPLYFNYDVWATRAVYELEMRSDGLLMADRLRLRSTP
jgi:peptide/nickel transport system substrate-binding protein